MPSRHAILCESSFMSGDNDFSPSPPTLPIINISRWRGYLVCRELNVEIGIIIISWKFIICPSSWRWVLQFRGCEHSKRRPQPTSSALTKLPLKTFLQARQLFSRLFTAIPPSKSSPILGIVSLNTPLDVKGKGDIGPVSLQSLPLLQIGFRKTAEIMVGGRERHWRRHHRIVCSFAPEWPPFPLLPSSVLIWLSSQTHKTISSFPMRNKI